MWMSSLSLSCKITDYSMLFRKSIFLQPIAWMWRRKNAITMVNIHLFVPIILHESFYDLDTFMHTGVTYNFSILYVPPLYQIYIQKRIISRCVPCLAMESPSWCLRKVGWTTCLLYGGPSQVYVSLRQLMCKFDIMERNFGLLLFCLICLHTVPNFCLLSFLSNGFILQ